MLNIMEELRRKEKLRIRMQGEFYTPAAWSKQAHKMLDEIGDWKADLVIDCACGIANLTQGLSFSNLVLSTLRQEDIDVIKEQGYNEGALIEQWDFLNDAIPDSIVEKLKAAKGKRVIWFSNPPYGTAGSGGAGTAVKAGIAKNAVNERMTGMGNAAQQLYTQFMYRINEITEEYSLESVLAFYTKPAFIRGPKYQKFAELWQKNWEYIDGILLPAGDFSGTSNKWGISFTIWRYNEDNT